MPGKIGLLLPRSGEYPNMSFDINDGFRLGLQEIGLTDIQIVSDNSGFGEDTEQTNSKAERFVMSDDVDLIVSYTTSLNAESLYEFSKTSGRPILFIDAGMEIFSAPVSPTCYHLTLQGLYGSLLTGRNAAAGERKVIAATSFYDGGYRGPWAIAMGIDESKGSVCANYVSAYKPEDFSVDSLLHFIEHTGAQSITACFSMYLTELFMKGLKEKSPASTSLPFYCTPFMAEEIWLEKSDFPGGTFHTIVPWSSSIENPAQAALKNALMQKKNKAANLFSLLGWEAAHAAAQILQNGISSLGGWSFESPRGTVTFHPESHSAYAPMYNGMIEAGENGKSKLRTLDQISISAEEHLEFFNKRIDGDFTRWRNNYFCI